MIKIGYDHVTESTYLSKQKRLKTCLQEALELCREYVTIETEEQISEFAMSFKDYVYKRKTEGTQLASLKRDSVLQMLDIPFDKINSLQLRYEELPKVSLTTPSFDVVIDSKEDIALFNKIEKLCKAINEFGYTPFGYSERISQAFGNTIVMDSDSNKFIPSWKHIVMRVKYQLV